jgi:two-component system, cell cycle sensor histidine kinase and response regulator CckA
MAMSESEQAQRSKETERFASLGQVAGELIHDLANVVAVVHGRATLALSDAQTGRPPTADLERLVEATDDLSGMLRDVLEVLRGARISPEVRFDPIQIIERTVRRFLDSAPPLEIRLISTLPDNTQVPGRASFLARSVLNLLNNAARYARSEICITVSLAEAEKSEVVLLVEDDGPGLPPSLLGELFRPLVGREADGAAGLGLSSVGWAVRQLGGGIRHRNDTLLGGAAFEVRLPALLQTPAVVSTPAIPYLDMLVGRRLVLLEDDASVQRALVRLLRRMGAEVSAFDPSFASEDEILQTLLRAMPDAILLDLRLGARRGGDLWRTLQKQVPKLASHVIFLSGLTSCDSEWEDARATGQPTLSKPVDLAELGAALAHVLRGENG